jgi:hypothetical protein
MQFRLLVSCMREDLKYFKKIPLFRSGYEFEFLRFVKFSNLSMSQNYVKNVWNTETCILVYMYLNYKHRSENMISI